MRFFIGSLLLFACFSCVPNFLKAQCTSVSENDSLELVRFHNTLNGVNWGDTAWASIDHPVEIWEGITLTEDKCHVFGIQLSSTDVIKGIIPDNLAFPFLEVLILQNDSIYGPVPEFADCPNLKQLNLSNNVLSGDIPNFALDSLENLNLSGNVFTGSLPDLQLNSLKNLNVSFNELTGTFPNFSNLPSLTELFVCPNNFDIGYPDLTEGAPLLNTDIVDFSCLNCTRIDQTDSLQLLNLYESLGGNSWFNQTGWADTAGIAANLWYGLELSRDECSVTGIDLTNNNLSGNIPSDFTLNELTSLRLSQNNIVGVVPDFANVPNLEILELFSNDLQGELPDFQLPKLRGLDASFNNLSGVIPDFSNLGRLEQLSLRLNQFEGPLPDFTNLDTLKFLLLDHNNIDGAIPNFNLPNLEVLNLSDNQLGAEIPDFDGLPKLQVLSIENNGLCGNLPAFNNTPDLSFLSVCPNTYLYGSIPSFSNMTELNSDEIDFSCIQENQTFDCAFYNSLENLNISDLTVYPNPTRGFIQVNTIELTDAPIRVYNLLGELLIEQTMSSTNSVIDLSALQAGMYLLEMQLTDKQIVRQSVIKM